MTWSPVLQRSFVESHLEAIHLGHPVVDEYLAFAGARLRLNSWLAVAFDLKVFFFVVGKEPAAVTTADCIRVHQDPTRTQVWTQSGPPGGRRGRIVGSYYQTAPGLRLRVVRLSAGPR